MTDVVRQKVVIQDLGVELLDVAAAAPACRTG